MTRPLGEGGMASVWLAEDTLLGRTVALKVLADALARSPDACRRFRHEADVAALLDHPAIVPVHDHGEDAGTTYLTMTWIDGESLAERLTRGLLPVREAIDIASVVLSALGYAHARGVLHRDVTPRNIMLARDGRVFLFDFGLALVEGFSRITRSDSTLGTLIYMAPEALENRDVDPRSDLYGLAAVLYEMLTGSPPFAFDQAPAVVYAKLHTKPDPPSRLRPEVDPALDAVLLCGLAREPAERFPDAEAFLAALQAATPGRTGGFEAAAAAGPRPPVVAAALAEGLGTAYLGIPAFDLDDARDDAVGRLATELAGALRRRLGQMHRVHVVPASAPLGPDEDARAWSRRHGANLLLLGRVRCTGTRVRVDCTLLDPESGLILAGEAVDGSVLESFELEDRIVKAARDLIPVADAVSDGAAAAGTEPAPEDRFAQALRYLQRHDHEPSVDGAIGLLERVIAARGDDGVTCAALARAYLAKYGLTRQHAWESRAAAMVERASRVDPDAPTVLLARAAVQALAGREDEARELFQRVLAADPDSFEGWFGLAQLHEQNGRYDEAEAACRHAIAAQPRDWRGYSRLGRVFHARGQHALAIGPWRRVLRMSPDNARAAMNLGAAYYHLDRFDEALVAFRRSLDIEPTAVGYTNLGTTLYTLHRFDEAVAMFERATRLRPADARLWGNLANACQYAPGHAPRAAASHERAIGLMQEQLSRDPDDSEGWALLAGWLQSRGRGDEAEAALRRALAIAPESVRVLVQAGHVHVQRGDFDGAVRWLGEAVAHGHGRGELLRSIELEPLRGHPGFESIVHPEGPPPGDSPNPGA